MSTPPPPPDTQWYGPQVSGDSWGAAYAAAYEDLKRAAHLQLRSARGLLDTTVLVNETYLKLRAGNGELPADRRHLLALSARAMRHVLVDEARRLQADKRGGGLQQVTLATCIGMDDAGFNVLEVDQLLEALAEVDPRAAQVVELRCFGGYTEPEIAEMLEVTDRTVQRDWRKARAFLLAQMT